MFCANKNLPKDIVKCYSHLNNIEMKLSKLYEKFNSTGLAVKKPIVFPSLAAANKVAPKLQPASVMMT